MKVKKLMVINVLDVGKFLKINLKMNCVRCEKVVNENFETLNKEILVF